MTHLAFITGNDAKAKEVERYLLVPVKRYTYNLPEIQSLVLEHVVRDKAERAYAFIKKPVLVEDVSVTFGAFQYMLPGPFIKWFVEGVGNEALCRMLDGYDNRTAIAEVQYGFHDSDGVHIFSGKTEGIIADTPRGEDGFGWNSIFIPSGQKKTRAEMTDEEKDRTSMRKKALGALKEYLKERNIP
ncbi:MAG: non-canonical purine NTP pyrophosphatase [Candidatus Ryanbacteria bacterium CG10_big_fil_rev_8_21_14_0_10_43_42]|uniref:Non-canonical purine NTP pyrophosphatase n=1 Tax=Candidatus Ryanbacteria bacterium CG10_big_fil_rev_8_21_14_0_10_43_42 TaxID=1974864 RepID=A0A2M8KXH8_9BACT|nr:MAG: non-canonical purine NTP pyrophosphatase [Candidatus Ryanbacteria bacterium CG10_big_fil_rev_8_21_14_0_10_43_42]